MGRVPWAPEVFNCNAPDTGNMETIERYGSDEQQAQWLEPLLARRDPLGVPDDGAGRGVVGCDEYPVQHRARWRQLRDQRPQVVVVGRGRSALQGLYRHGQDRSRSAEASAAIDDPGSRRTRPASPCIGRSTVFGYDDAPHGHMEITLENVRVPASNMLLGEGRGFEIAQGRLGPGRIHHCMRLIGLAERALELMSKRTLQRVAFGKPIAAARRDAGAHRRGAHHDRTGAAPDAEGRVHDGHRRQQGRARRDRDDQGRRAEHGVSGDRLGDSGARRRAASATIFRWRMRMRRRARCVSPMAPTKCIAMRSRSWNSRGIMEPHG